jgi:hypothetical protein
MKFFPNPEKAAEKKFADTRASRDALAVRLTAAQDAVASAHATLHQLAVEGAVDATLADGEAKLRDTERRVATLTPALVEIDKLLATLEAERAEMLDKKTRTATALATNALADELVEVAAGYHASTSALAEVATRALAVTMEANGLAVFTASSLIEVAAAIPVVAEVLRQHARAVTNNLAPAAMPKPAPQPVKPVPLVKEPLTLIFSTRAIRWKDHAGFDRCSSKFLDCELPASTAAHALKIGAALRLDDPARKANLGMWPGHVSLGVSIWTRISLDRTQLPRSTIQWCTACSSQSIAARRSASRSQLAVRNDPCTVRSARLESRQNRNPVRGFEADQLRRQDPHGRLRDLDGQSRDTLLWGREVARHA